MVNAAFKLPLENNQTDNEGVGVGGLKGESVSERRVSVSERRVSVSERRGGSERRGLLRGG